VKGKKSEKGVPALLAGQGEEGKKRKKKKERKTRPKVLNKVLIYTETKRKTPKESQVPLPLTSQRKKSKRAEGTKETTSTSVI